MTAQPMMPTEQEGAEFSKKDSSSLTERGITYATNDRLARDLLQLPPIDTLPPLERKMQDTQISVLIRYAEQGDKDKFVEAAQELSPGIDVDEVFAKYQKLVQFHIDLLKQKREYDPNANEEQKKEHLHKIELSTRNIEELDGPIDTPERQKKLDERQMQNLEDISKIHNLNDTQRRDMLAAAALSGFSASVILSLEREWKLDTPEEETSTMRLPGTAVTGAGERVAQSLFHEQIKENNRNQARELDDILDRTKKPEDRIEEAQKTEQYAELAGRIGTAGANRFVTSNLGTFDQRLDDAVHQIYVLERMRGPPPDMAAVPQKGPINAE
ncbi:hypothetical protein JXA56_05200 [Candidatus Micrarchaeota archaeon]|nr:hypothetical protein [Candidatus Micrarchaeota archaeon]